ncbi:MAG: hypothetical protein ACP5HG_02695 [Anaerolineae bacterium]
MAERDCGDAERALAEATELPESMAQIVLETAIEYIASRRPNLAPKMRRLLASPDGAKRVAELIGRLGRSLDPRLR